jgi:hypothetical protein
MRLKRWESPRREGRNDKGKKSAARQRQIKKQTQMLRKKLKGDGERSHSLPTFLAICGSVIAAVFLREMDAIPCNH